MLTDGVLNPMQPATNADPQRGLFLIGGPSAHYRWDTTQIVEQVATLIKEQPDIHWTLTTSRRTPPDCTQQLIDLSCSNLDVVPVEETQRGWVANSRRADGIVNRPCRKKSLAGTKFGQAAARTKVCYSLRKP